MDYQWFGAWIPSIILVLFVVILLFAYERWKKRELEKCGIPGPKAWPIIGNLYNIIKYNTEHCEEEWFDKYGDIIGYRFGQLLNISVKDPDILRQVLVKNFSNFTNRRLIPFTPSPVDKGIFFSKGRTWKRIRTILSPTFSAGKLKQMNKAIERCANLLSTKMEKHAENGDVVSVKELYGAFTMDVIASTAFGLQVDSQNNPDDPFIKHAKAIFGGHSAIFRPALFTAVMFPFTARFFRMLEISFFPKFVINFFVKEVTAMVEDRRKHPLDIPDFLQLMINAELDDENSDSVDPSTTEKKHLSTNEIIAQAFLFFVAGYETTASLLRFASYQLAVNPEIQDKVIEEIQEKLGEEQPNYENVARLTYMEQVLYETLRICPPLGRVNREVAETISMDGVTFPKGAAIQIPIHMLHHDPRFYPNPEVFDPESNIPPSPAYDVYISQLIRYASASIKYEDFLARGKLLTNKLLTQGYIFATKSSQNDVTFLPFGFGPRICIGMRLALFEAKIALVHVLRRVKFVRSEETEVPLKLVLGRGLTTTANPIKIKLEKR